MWDWESIWYWVQNNMGKIIGLFIALVFSLLIIHYGFLKTVFVLFCCFIGIYLGKTIDDQGNIRDKLKDFFRKNY